MLLPSYAFLLGVGLIANIKDWRMLALTILVGCNVFAPIPSSSSEEFYSYCILAETILIIGAVLLNTKASILVIELASVLIIVHVMGYSLDGSQPLSPYRVIVKVCEYSQLTICIAFSSGLFPSLRNRLS